VLDSRGTTFRKPTSPAGDAPALVVASPGRTMAAYSNA
jgi:hypothetical protein